MRVRVRAHKCGRWGGREVTFQNSLGGAADGERRSLRPQQQQQVALAQLSLRVSRCFFPPPLCLPRG